MTRADGPSEIDPLLAAVEEAPELSDELRTRYRMQPPVRGVSVTELLDPRGSYWRSVHPIPATPEEEARLQEGQALHERLGRYLVPARAREVRVRKDGIVGRIDVLDDRPTELKSTGSPPDPAEDLRTSRPSYIEQLAMYGALADRREGRLVVVRAGEVRAGSVNVWDVPLGRLERIAEEMRRRASEIRHARAANDPSSLPRCAWFDRGCAYRAGGVCDCTGAESNLPMTLLEEVGAPQLNSPEARRIEEWLIGSECDPRSFARFRELAYPRRAYFDAHDPGRGAAETPKRAAGEDETWSALQAVLESGPSDEYEIRHSASGEPAEAVPCFRSIPCLVKSTRTLRPVPAGQLRSDRPHYLLELALRCAAVGATQGYLFTGLERVPSEGPWIHAQRVRFGSEAALAALLERRASQLGDARTRGSADGLPSCPRWMFDGCPHRDVCGCGPDPAAAPGS